MRGLLKAALLLAPALARAVSLGSTDDAIPSAFINLRLPESGHEPFPQDLAFRFDVLESKDACGYANVTINGQTLPKGGSGSLTADQDRAFIASWNFTCVTWNDEPQEQLMSFEVNYVNGNPVKDVGFTIRFQQVAPVWISDIEGSASMTRVHKIGESKSDFAKDEMDRDMDDELAELDFLRMQLAELEQRIFMKEKHLSHVFGWSDKKGIGQCDNLKCVMKAIYHKMSGAAVAFYGDLDFFQGEGPRHHRHHSRPHWEHPHGKPGHGNHTHGNHTFPHPPWHHPPHHKKPGFPHPPPFCKCPPPPPPPPPPHHHHPEEPPHRGPPGPPPPPPPPPPFDGPDHEFPHDFPPDFPPDFDRHDHHRGPWHHEPHEGGRPHHGPPPPPPFEDDHPERPMDFERPNGPPHEPPQGPPHGDHPEEDGPPFPPPPPPPPHHRGGHHPGGHGRPPPPPPFRRFPHPVKAIVTIVLLTILVTMLHRRFCLRGTREERQARRQSRRESFRRRRAARKARCKSFFSRICFGRFCADDCDDDEEKTAMMRERSDSEDSTTMEQEIASFRTAADMVGDMVAAEEGRSHQQCVFHHHHHPGHEVRQIPAELPSPTSAFPEYHGIQDEALPAYEDSNDNNSAMGTSVVTDGFRYTPGSSIYTPSSDGDSSVGADDVLRDTKH